MQRFPVDAFSQSKAGKWSPKQQLIHLVSSASPVAISMHLPKAVFSAFGTRAGESLSYDGVVGKYQDKLNKGAKAPIAFRPVSITNPSREKLLLQWKKVLDNFRTALYLQWDEADLDKYRMPHPLLGMLTVREMLLFTIYHTLHHLNSMKSVYGQ